MDGLDRLLRAVEAEDRRSLAEAAITALTAAGIEDDGNRGLYAGAAQRLRDGLRSERWVLR